MHGKHCFFFSLQLRNVEARLASFERCLTEPAEELTEAGFFHDPNHGDDPDQVAKTIVMTMITYMFVLPSNIEGEMLPLR